MSADCQALTAAFAHLFGTLDCRPGWERRIMRLILGSWTEADNQRLKALVEQGASIVRVAGIFNRTIGAVRNQARKIGSPFPPMRVFRKKWADKP